MGGGGEGTVGSGRKVDRGGSPPDRSRIPGSGFGLNPPVVGQVPLRGGLLHLTEDLLQAPGKHYN